MRRELKKVLSKNCLALQNSSGDLKAIYEIMFNNDGVFAEYTDGFRIHKKTYREVREQIEKAAGALHDKIGANHEYVALEMENCLEWIIAFWAILKSGNKPYLVNCRHPKALSDKNLKTLGIKYIVGKSESKLDAEYIDIKDLKDGKPVSDEFENEIALSTSATSLKDVICIYSGKELTAQILNVKHFIYEYPEIAEDCDGEIKILAFLPFYHVFGLIAVYLWFAFFGRTVVFLKDYASETILKTCRKHKVTHIFAVPLLWHTIENTLNKKVESMGENKVKKLNKGLRLCTSLQNIFPHFGMKLSQKIMSEVTDELFGQSVRFCISGGSYIRTSALELINGLGYNLHNGYGMSEIGITSVDLRIKPKEKNQNSIGKPFASVEYRIDSQGILWVKGSTICKKLIMEGVEHPLGEWFNTGDRMNQKDGTYFIVGRQGDVTIGENGENINPDTIEQHFYLPEAENFSVLGIKEDGKELVGMVVQVDKFISDAKTKELIQKIYSQNDKLPITLRVQKVWFTADSILPSQAIKVGRKSLLQSIENKTVRLSPCESFRAETTATDNEYSTLLLDTVLEVVAKNLSLEPKDININTHLLSELGATSMQYFSICSELAEKFNIQAEQGEELRYTVHEICKYIERRLR